MKKYWNYFIRFAPWLTVIFLFLLVQTCARSENQINKYKANMEALSSKTESFRLKNGQLAHRNKMLVVSEEDLREQVWIKDDSMKVLIDQAKNPKMVIKWKTKIVIDTFFMSFDTPVPFEFNRTFKNKNPWYLISGNVDQNGVTLNPPIIPNKPRLLVDYVRGQPVVTIVNSNPHIVNDSIQGQVIDIPKRHWVVGGGVVLVPVAPYTLPGLFVGYKFFQF